MKKALQGRVWKFGDNINTDIISSPQYMELSIDDAAKYAMSAVSQDFASHVKTGDLFVAEHNLGSGSSRETSPLTLKHLGIEAVIAKSFARIFYRNCINIGLPAIVCSQSDRISNHDEIMLNIREGVIINMTKQEQYSCEPLPDNILAMTEAGGLVAYLQQRKLV